MELAQKVKGVEFGGRVVEKILPSSPPWISQKVEDMKTRTARSVDDVRKAPGFCSQSNAVKRNRQALR